MNKKVTGWIRGVNITVSPAAHKTLSAEASKLGGKRGKKMSLRELMDKKIGI